MSLRPSPAVTAVGRVTFTKGQRVTAPRLVGRTLAWIPGAVLYQLPAPPSEATAVCVAIDGDKDRGGTIFLAELVRPELSSTR